LKGRCMNWNPFRFLPTSIWNVGIDINFWQVNLWSKYPLIDFIAIFSCKASIPYPLQYFTKLWIILESVTVVQNNCNIDRIFSEARVCIQQLILLYFDRWQLTKISTKIIEYPPIIM
jgi:hypothetical protein